MHPKNRFERKQLEEKKRKTFASTGKGKVRREQYSDNVDEDNVYEFEAHMADNHS